MDIKELMECLNEKDKAMLPEILLAAYLDEDEDRAYPVYDADDCAEGYYDD